MLKQAWTFFATTLCPLSTGQGKQDMYRPRFVKDFYVENFRTDLDFEWEDGSRALKFDFAAFAAFDLFILNRIGAENDYSEQQIEIARKKLESMSQSQQQLLVNTIIKGLPGRTSGSVKSQMCAIKLSRL